MTPILAPSKKVFSSDESIDVILCYYVNQTGLIQVIQLANSLGNNFEKIIFPGQRLLFESEPDAKLKIQTGLAGTAVLKAEISCDCLCVMEEEESDFG